MNIIIAVIAAAMGFTGGWQIQAHFILKKELEHANERIGIQRVARQNIEAAVSRFSAAQAESEARLGRYRDAADGARTDLGRLRDASAAAVRAVTADPTTCADATATAHQLFIASTEAYTELAKQCDGHVNDILTLRASR